MLRIAKTDTFAARVKVRLPTDDPDRHAEGDFVARYRFIPRREFAALQDEFFRIATAVNRALHGEDEDAGASEITEFRARLLDRVLVSVEGIGDENGEAYPAERQLAMVRENLMLVNAAAEAFFTAYNGAPEKNSKKSRSN